MGEKNPPEFLSACLQERLKVIEPIMGKYTAGVGVDVYITISVK